MLGAGRPLLAFDLSLSHEYGCSITCYPKMCKFVMLMQIRFGFLFSRRYRENI